MCHSTSQTLTANTKTTAERRTTPSCEYRTNPTTTSWVSSSNPKGDGESRQIKILWGDYKDDYELVTAIGESIGLRYKGNLSDDDGDYFEAFVSNGPFAETTTLNIYKLVSGAGELSTTDLNNIKARLAVLQQEYDALSQREGVAVPTQINSLTYAPSTRTITLAYTRLGVQGQVEVVLPSPSPITDLHGFEPVSSQTELDAVATDGTETVLVTTAFGSFNIGDILTYRNSAWTLLINLQTQLNIAAGSITEAQLTQALQDKINAALRVSGFNSRDFTVTNGTVSANGHIAIR